MRGERRGRVTQKAGYDGGNGSNGDSRDFERGGHGEINCWVSPYILLLCFFERAEEDGSVDLKKMSSLLLAVL